MICEPNDNCEVCVNNDGCTYSCKSERSKKKMTVYLIKEININNPSWCRVVEVVNTLEKAVGMRQICEKYNMCRFSYYKVEEVEVK